MGVTVSAAWGTRSPLLPKGVICDSCLSCTLSSAKDKKDAVPHDADALLPLSLELSLDALLPHLACPGPL